MNTVALGNKFTATSQESGGALTVFGGHIRGRKVAQIWGNLASGKVERNVGAKLTKRRERNFIESVGEEVELQELGGLFVMVDGENEKHVVATIDQDFFRRVRNMAYLRHWAHPR